MLLQRPHVPRRRSRAVVPVWTGHGGHGGHALHRWPHTSCQHTTVHAQTHNTPTPTCALARTLVHSHIRVQAWCRQHGTRCRQHGTHRRSPSLLERKTHFSPTADAGGGLLATKAWMPMPTNPAPPVTMITMRVGVAGALAPAASPPTLPTPHAVAQLRRRCHIAAAAAAATSPKVAAAAPVPELAMVQGCRVRCRGAGVTGWTG